MRSLGYRSGSVRLNDFEKQNHSLTDLIPLIKMEISLMNFAVIT